MKRIVLVDGDIIAYRAGFAAEHTTYTLEYDGRTIEFPNKSSLNEYLKDIAENDPEAEYSWESNLSVEPLSHALSTVKHMLSNIQEAVKADGMLVFLSGSTNFRDSVATIKKYKANRDKTRKPIHHKDIVEYMRATHHAILSDGCEADDMLADVSAALTKLGYEPVICSLDKDLLQISGKYYDFVKNKRYQIDEVEAQRSLWRQVLSGDRTDNIPGIYGCGPSTAKAIIGGLESSIDMQVACVEKWTEYLKQENPKDKWWTAFDEVNHTITYTPYNEDKEITIAIGELLHELYMLLKVGEESENNAASEEASKQYLITRIPEQVRERAGIHLGKAWH